MRASKYGIVAALAGWTDIKTFGKCTPDDYRILSGEALPHDDEDVPDAGDPEDGNPEEEAEEGGAQNMEKRKKMETAVICSTPLIAMKPLGAGWLKMGWRKTALMVELGSYAVAGSMATRNSRAADGPAWGGAISIRVMRRKVRMAMAGHEVICGHVVLPVSNPGKGGMGPAEEEKMEGGLASCNCDAIMAAQLEGGGEGVRV